MKPLILIVLFVAISGGAQAEIKLIKQQAVGYNNAAMKFIADDGRTYFVSLELKRVAPETRSFFLRLEDFFDSSSARLVPIDSGAPLFMAMGPQHGLITITKGYENMAWVAVRLNKALTRVEKIVELKSMVAIGPTARINDKYYIAGIDEKSRQSLLKINKDLRIEREWITSDPKRLYAVSSGN